MSEDPEKNSKNIEPLDVCDLDQLSGGGLGSSIPVPDESADSSTLPAPGFPKGPLNDGVVLW